jgi:hypothetical protein
MRNDSDNSYETRTPEKKGLGIFKLAAIGAGSLAAAGLFIDSFAVVGPNQVACFRTLGTPDCGPSIQVKVDGKMETSHAYYTQGLHWPLVPFFTTVDTIQISKRLTPPHTNHLTLGQQNQPAEIDYRLLVNIPQYGMHRPDGTYVDSVYNLLYGLGPVGSTDVDSTVDTVVDAGINKAFSPIEPDNMSSQRGVIIDGGDLVLPNGTTTHTDGITKKVAGDLAQLGVDLASDIKITRAELQGAWKEAANIRVHSLGEKQAAENQALARKSAGEGEGDFLRAKAAGQAAATNAIAQADADYITKLRAAFGGDNNALAVFWLAKTGTALPQVMGSSGIQIVPNIETTRPALVAGQERSAPAVK